MRRNLPPLPSRVLAAVLAAVLGSILTPAAPAWAHTRLVSSTPSQGVPAPAPGQVLLAFSETVQPGLSSVSVTGPDGEEHAAGSPSRAGDGTSVVQAMRSPLPAGSYRVAYRVLAADGHPVTGSFEITAVAAPSAAASLAAEPSAAAPQATTRPLTPAADVRDADGGLPLLPMVAGGLLVAGGAGLLARRLGGAPPEA